MIAGRFVRYLLIGGLNTVVGLALIFGFMNGAGLSPVAANTLAYAICILGSYALNRRFTFHDRGRAPHALPRFIAVQGTAWLTNLATLLMLHQGLGAGETAAQLVAVAVYTAVGFLGSNYLVFKPAGERDGQ